MADAEDVCRYLSHTIVSEKSSLDNFGYWDTWKKQILAARRSTLHFIKSKPGKKLIFNARKSSNAWCSEIWLMGESVNWEIWWRFLFMDALAREWFSILQLFHTIFILALKEDIFQYRCLGNSQTLLCLKSLELYTNPEKPSHFPTRSPKKQMKKSIFLDIS